MIIHSMQNPPYIMLSRRSFRLYAKRPLIDFELNEEEPVIVESQKKEENKFLLQNPCEYFIFFSLMSIWLGSWVRKKLYNVLNKK